MYRRCLRVFASSSHTFSTGSRVSRCRLPAPQSQHSQDKRSRYSRAGLPLKVGLLAGAAALGGAVVADSKQEQPADEDPESEEMDVPGDVKSTRYRKTRMFNHFCSFATYKYRNELFMTGDDFLKAVLSKDLKTRPRKVPFTALSEGQYEGILEKAPVHNKETRGMFRSLGRGALISYPEYLFLVSILSKPKDHFLKTFQMIDVDGNWVLTKEEFELIEQLFSRGVVDESPLNTTLKVHLFRADGTGVITFDDFTHFLDTLQKECLELEFNEYSHGKTQITDTDFTRILMDRTSLGEIDKDKYMKRVANREQTGHNGVTFSQYSQFMNLLNDIHDLEIALRMFQIAKKPVTPDEFQRAVRVCTGTPLDLRMIELTFKIFDDDGDGALSHNEFMKVMKDRIHNRGTVDVQIQPNSWRAFRRCVQQQMTLGS